MVVKLQIIYIAEDRCRFREIRKRVREEFSVATDIDNSNYFLYFGLEDSGFRKFCLPNENVGQILCIIILFPCLSPCRQDQFVILYFTLHILLLSRAILL